MSKKLPKSLRKFIRKEKARIRREVLDLEKQKELINQLYPVRKPEVGRKDKKNKVNNKKNESF
jgi:hypothetical protein